MAIHVEEQGDGDLSLVFLHYWGGSSRTWKYVTAKLAPNFHTIALDHRSWGESDAPADGYALANLAADAEGVINGPPGWLASSSSLPPSLSPWPCPRKRGR